MLNEGSVVRKIMWRILPLTFLLFVVQYLDRVNLGYAALQMNDELGLSSEAFGFAAGIFFIGNLFFEVPSNILMKKYGARRWLTRIILSWAVVSALTAFVTHSWQLYILRFLLGAAEAGFYPGVIYFYSFWFREKERAFAVATFSAAVPVTYLLGAPLSTWLMQAFSNAGLSGWRWMMFVEALPAIIGGGWSASCLFQIRQKRLDGFRWTRRHGSPENLRKRPRRLAPSSTLGICRR